MPLIVIALRERRNETEYTKYANFANQRDTTAGNHTFDANTQIGNLEIKWSEIVMDLKKKYVISYYNILYISRHKAHI